MNFTNIQIDMFEVGRKNVDPAFSTTCYYVKNFESEGAAYEAAVDEARDLVRRGAPPGDISITEFSNTAPIIIREACEWMPDDE